MKMKRTPLRIVPIEHDAEAYRRTAHRAVMDLFKLLIVIAVCLLWAGIYVAVNPL
jgi:hypothetical protein